VLCSLSVAGDDERLQKEIAGLADALNEVFARPDAIDADEADNAVARALLAKQNPVMVNCWPKITWCTAMRTLLLFLSFSIGC
jgi:hypothetical protein